MDETVAHAEPSEDTTRATARARVLTKATHRVAVQLGLGQANLARVIGISPSTASRMYAGNMDYS